MNQYIQLLCDVYNSASTVKTRSKFTTVNELTDQVPATRPEVLEAAAMSIINLGMMIGTKLLSEEDKGAAMAGLISVVAKIPLAMARHNVPYEIPDSIVVPYSMEYQDGKLTVNGIKAGDLIHIVDDTLASGGTIIALSKACMERGAQIVDVRVVVEKLGFGGRDKLIEFGIHPNQIKSVIGISIDQHGTVSVEEILQEKVWNLA